MLNLSGDWVVNVSASQPRVMGLPPTWVYDHDSSYDTSTGWFQEADSKVIYLSCENLFHSWAKISMFKLNF